MHKFIGLRLFAFVPALAFAVDGQVLINQAAVMAAGGFPYVISQPGSYKLSGNLVVPSYKDGIHIQASNVTLDLNGFSIFNPLTIESAVGILAAPGNSIRGGPIFVTGTTIRNGNIRGFLSPISLGTGNSRGGSDWTLENLIMTGGLPGNALTLDSFSRVEHVTAPDMAILIVCPSVVAFTTARKVVSIHAFGSNAPGTGCGFTGNSTAQ